MVLHLHEVAFLLPKNALTQVWLKWKKKWFLNIVSLLLLLWSFIWTNKQGYFVPSLFEICPRALKKDCLHHMSSIIFPWKRTWPLFEQTWIPYNIKIKWWFVPSLVEIGLMVLEKEGDTTTTTDKEKNDQKSSLES